MATQEEYAAGGSSGNSYRWFYGWIILAVCTAVIFVVTGTRGSFGAFFKAMQRDLAWDRATTAGAAAISTVAWALSLPLAGRLVDRYGAKRVMVASVALMIVSVVPIFWVQSLWTLYLFYGVLPGVASSGASMVPAALLISRWFYRNAGIASGIASSAVPLGWALFSPLAALLIPLLGWRLSYVTISVCLVVILPFMLIFLRDAPRAGEVPEAESSRTRHEPSAERPLSSSQPRIVTLRRALKTPLYRLLLLSQISCGLLDHSLGVHFIPFVSDKGRTEVFAAYLLGATNLIAVAGSLFGGWLCDRFNRRSALCVMHGLRMIGFPMLILFGVTANNLWLYLFIVCYGATVIMGFPPTSLLVVRMYGHRSVGSLYGSLQVMHHLGMAAGAYFAGVVFDAVGSYYPVFVAATAIAAVATIGVSRIDEWRRPYYQEQIS